MGLFDALADPAFRGDVGRGLLDALNRGLVAQVLGGPMDMANIGVNAIRAGVGYAGHKMGLLSAANMPALDDKPVGGSEWIGDKLQKLGAVSGNRNEVAELLSGGVLGPAASVKLASSAPAIAKGLRQIGENARAPTTMKPEQGAIVWHGSPHKFDKFDSSKIGTGEGAQAYGHGLYLADARDTATTYQPRDTRLEKKIMAKYSAAERVQQYPAMQVYEDFLLHKTPQEVADNLAAAGYTGSELAAAQRALKQASDEYFKQRAGALYKVDLPDSAIARMLDLDKPLSQQAPDVQKAIAAVAPKNRSGQSMIGLDASGEEIMRALGIGDGASSLLRSQGVPGGRYLDGGSRNLGLGSSNYVVFPGEEAALRILERNGKKFGGPP